MMPMDRGMIDAHTHTSHRARTHTRRHKPLPQTHCVDPSRNFAMLRNTPVPKRPRMVASHRAQCARIASMRTHFGSRDGGTLYGELVDNRSPYYCLTTEHPPRMAPAVRAFAAVGAGASSQSRGTFAMPRHALALLRAPASWTLSGRPKFHRRWSGNFSAELCGQPLGPADGWLPPQPLRGRAAPTGSCSSAMLATVGPTLAPGPAGLPRMRSGGQMGSRWRCLFGGRRPRRQRQCGNPRRPWPPPP